MSISNSPNLLSGVTAAQQTSTAITGAPRFDAKVYCLNAQQSVSMYSGGAPQTGLPPSDYAREIPTMVGQGITAMVAGAPTAAAKVAIEVKVLDQLVQELGGSVPPAGAPGTAGAGPNGAMAAAPSLKKTDDHTIDTGRYLISGSMDDTASIHVTDKQTGTTLDVFGDPHIKDGAGDHASFRDKALVVNLSDGSTLRFNPTAVKDGHSFVDNVEVTKDGQTDKMTFAGSVGIAENAAATQSKDEVIQMRSGSDLNNIELNSSHAQLGPLVTLKEFSQIRDGLSDSIKKGIESSGRDVDSLDGIATAPDMTWSPPDAVGANVSGQPLMPIDYSIWTIKSIDPRTIDTGRYLIKSDPTKEPALLVTDKLNNTTVTVTFDNRLLLSDGSHSSFRLKPVTIALGDGTKLTLQPNAIVDEKPASSLKSIKVERNGESKDFDYKAVEPPQVSKFDAPQAFAIQGYSKEYGDWLAKPIELKVNGDLNSLSLSTGIAGQSPDVYLHRLSEICDKPADSTTAALFKNSGSLRDRIDLLVVR